VLSWVEEFKEFAVRGNAIDMAVGIIVGGGFTKWVSSLVSDIIMPPISLLMGNKLSHLHWQLKPSTGDSPAIVFNYGQFLQTTLDFIIVAFCIFLIVKVLNRLRRLGVKDGQKT
jgi:large conductance mechanosensitive channel